MRVLIYIAIVLLSTLSFTQTRNYDVLLGDKIVGSVVATKSIIGDEVTYKTDFKIKIRVFKTYNINSVSTVTFKSGKLTKGNTLVYKDNELDDETIIFREGLKYFQQKSDEKKEITSADILTDVTKIYFHEPIKQSDIFTMRYLDFGTMTKLEEGGYKLKLPNGDVNKYYFEGGMLDKIIANRTLYKLTFKYRSN